MTIDEWLESIGLNEYAPVFRENHIDITILEELTSEDLSALGIVSLGHRKRLLAEIQKINPPEESTPATKKFGAWIYTTPNNDHLYWLFEFHELKDFMEYCHLAIPKVLEFDKEFKSWAYKNWPKKLTETVYFGRGSSQESEDFEDDSARHKYEIAFSRFLARAPFELLKAGCLAAMNNSIFLCANKFNIDDIRYHVKSGIDAFKKLNWSAESMVEIVGWSRLEYAQSMFTEFVKWGDLIEPGEDEPKNEVLGLVDASFEGAEDGGQLLQPVGVRVVVDPTARRETLVSGKVTFSDGIGADWYVNQKGRFFLVPPNPGYRPSPKDLAEFQTLLEQDLAKLGL